MKRILLLGGQGQLGYAIAQAMQQTRHQLLMPSRQQLDLNDFAATWAYLKAHPVEVIINAAAYTQVDAAETARLACYRINSLLAKLLATFVAQSNTLLVHFSTDYVFDGNQKTPYTVDDQPNPLNYYGYSKWLGEQAIVQSGAYALVLRTSWLYHPHYGQNFYRRIQQLAREKTCLSVVDDQIGVPNDVRDIAAVIMRLLAYTMVDLYAASGLYHLTATQAQSWYAFAQQIVTDMPDKSCQRLQAICSQDYPSAAERPAYSVLQVHLPDLLSEPLNHAKKHE